MTCLIISSPPSTSQKKGKNARRRRKRRTLSPAYGEPQQQLDDVLKGVNVLISAEDVLSSMQQMKESSIVVPVRPARHEASTSSASEPTHFQNFGANPMNLPTRRAPPPPPRSLEEPQEDPPDLPMNNIVIGKKGDPYIGMRFSSKNGGQLVENATNRPSTSSAVVNHGYESLTSNQGYESLSSGRANGKAKPLPAIPARVDRRRRTSDSDTEVEQNLVKFREWDREKPGPSYIGTTAYEYRASKKDEISFKRGSVVEVMRKDCDVEGFAYAEVEGHRGIIPQHFVHIIGIEGRKINPKILEKGALIGDGGYSTVYRANYSGREVAMKMPKHVNRSAQQIRDALKQEAAIFNLFEHPNIVGFIGVSLDEPLCILLELCEGQSLKKLCKEAKNVPTKTITIWAMQVAIGMKHMHSQNPPVLHRDLKADNILVKEKPCMCGQESTLSKSAIGNYDVNGLCRNCYGLRLDKLTLKIADMGLARTQSTARQSTSGSTPWMAPELIRKQIMTTKSEIWSFGVLLWELITKEIPYLGTDAQTLLFAIGMGEISLPIPENCPEELKEILLECWKADFQQRPSFDRIMVLLEHAQDSLDSNYRIILDSKLLHEKTKYNIKEFINYINSNKNNFMSAMPNFHMEQIPEAPPVKREKKKKNKKHIDKLDIGAPIVRPSRDDEEDPTTSPTTQKQKLSIIRYYEETCIHDKRHSKDDLDAALKTPMDPTYDVSTLPRAKLGTTLSKNRGSEGNLSRNSFLSTPDLHDLFKNKDPAKIPQRGFEDGSSEDMLRRESSRALVRKPAFKRKKHHSGSSNSSLAMMNHDVLVAISRPDVHENGTGVVLNTSLDDTSSILLSTATSSPITDVDIRDGLVDPPTVVELASEEDYNERRARLNTIDGLPADVVATPRRAARTSSSNSHSTFYLSLDDNARTGSYSSLQDATVEIAPVHHSRERDKKKNKINHFVHKVGRFFSSSEKSENEQSYHSKQSSADQSSILSVDQVEFIQEDDDEQSVVTKMAHAEQLPQLPLRDFVSQSPQGKSQISADSGVKHKFVGCSTPQTGNRQFKKKEDTPAQVRQRIRTASKETISTPTNSSIGTPTSLLHTPPPNRRPLDSTSPTTPSKSPSSQPRFSIDTVVEFNNIHLPSPGLGTTIPSPSSVAPRLDRSLTTSASNLHRLESPDSISVDTFHQRSKSSDQTEAAKVSTNQEEMILFENRAYVSLTNGTYQRLKQEMMQKKPDQTAPVQNSNYIALNPKSNEKTTTTPRPPAPQPAQTIVPTLPLKLPPSRSPMSDSNQDLKPPPVPPRPVGGNRTSSTSTSLLNVIVEFSNSSPSPTSPCGGPLPRTQAPSIPEDASRPPARSAPSPSRLHTPPASMSTPPTPPRSDLPPPKERPKTLNLRTGHSPKTPESGLGSTIPSSATNESLKNVVNEPPKKIPAKSVKDNIPRRHDYIMLTDCSNTIPPSHFKPQSVGQEPANQKPIPAPRQETPKQQKKYQTEQHPKAQQRIHHNHELPKSTAPPLPEKNRSPKPVKTAPEETQPVRKIPPIPKMLQDKKPKK